MNFEDNSERERERERERESFPSRTLQNHAITPCIKGVNYRSHSGALPSGFVGEVSALFLYFV
jgi:hypothetical protein